VQLKNTDIAWGPVAKLFHWTIALLIFTQFALGWIAVTYRLSPTKIQLFVWHKSVGVLVLALVALRLIWRAMNPSPVLPLDTPPGERLAAHTSHGLLYALMIAMPLSGWIINSAANIPFRIFWWLPLPNIVAPDKALEQIAKQTHFVLFLLIAAVVAVHIAAALRHHFVKHNDILVRMLPRWRWNRESTD
jgi:cytochrome b561